MIRNLIPRAGALAALAWMLGEGTALADPVPAVAPGRDLVRSLEQAPLVVVARVGAVVPIGAGAYRTQLTIEQRLLGASTGAALGVAWEERAPSRPARLVTGDRILVGLEPLVVTSAWRTRLGREASVPPLTIAGYGKAWLPRPDGSEVALLRHYLSLPIDARRGPDARRHLLALAADAQPPLAVSAADRLAAIGSGTALRPAVAALVVGALERPAKTGVPDAIADWIAASKPAGLVGALDRALTRPGAAPGLAIARARLGDGAEAVLSSHARDSRPAMRAAVARTTTDSRLLARLVRDPDPRVREASASRLGGTAANLVLLEESLSDPVASVRGAGARAFAALGDPAVEPLHRIVREADAPARETALAALSLIGSPAASRAIADITANHPEEGIRELARLAITGRIGDVHAVDP